jgi:hypothetical protein
MSHKIILISFVMIFFLSQSVSGFKTDLTYLEDLFGGNRQNKAEFDDSVILVNQVIDKLEYKVGETIMVKPELVNYGNKNVTITYYAPLFFTVVKDQNDNIIWPPVGSSHILIPSTETLEPHMPFYEIGSTIQTEYPIILESAGKYNITSIAYFQIHDINKDQPFETVWSETREITILPEFPPNMNKLSLLKQFKSGIPTDKIYCKGELVLIKKLNDGSPACVKPETKIKLIERGWAKS